MTNLKFLFPLRVLVPTVAVVATSLLIGGCNYNDSKNQSAGAAEKTRTPGSTDAIVDFQTVKSKVFDSACVKCHGPQLAKAGIRLDQYASAFAHLATIKTEVESGDMPPPPPRGSVLSPEQKAMLLAWVDSGGPETTVVTPPLQPPTQPPVVVSPPTTPPTAPPTLPVPPTTPVAVPSFDDVSKAVFVPHCIKCHSNTVQKGRVNLEQYTNAAAHAKEIGDALDTDDMPRKAPALPANLKAIVYAWIDGGAPETVAPAAPVVKPPVIAPPKSQTENDNNDDNNDNEQHGRHS